MGWLKPLGEICIAGLVVGGVLMLLNLAPIDATIKRIITIIVIIVALIIGIKVLLGL
jgi:hypothetical protein